VDRLRRRHPACGATLGVAEHPGRGEPRLQDEGFADGGCRPPDELRRQARPRGVCLDAVRRDAREARRLARPHERADLDGRAPEDDRKVRDVAAEHDGGPPRLYDMLPDHHDGCRAVQR